MKLDYLLTPTIMSKIFTKCNFPEAALMQQKVVQAQYVIGLDLHKKTVGICVFKQGNDQPVFQRKRLENAKLLETLQKLEGAKVVIAESAFGSKVLRKSLNFPGIRVLLFNARKTAAWTEMSGVKTDKIDAEILAYAGLHGATPRLVVNPPSAFDEEHFKIFLVRDSLVKQATRVKNQLKAISRDYGQNPYTGEWMEKSPLIQELENLLLEELKSLQDKIRGLEKKMQKINQEEPTIQILRSIPGIGPITAYALRFKIGTIKRFEKSKNLSSYFGFGIRQHQSGENIRKGKITKTGDSLIRSLLVQGAHTLAYHHPEYLSLYFPKLSQECLKLKTKNKLAVALARKTLTFVYTCWNQGKMFDLEKYRKMRAEQKRDFKVVEPGQVLV